MEQVTGKNGKVLKVGDDAHVNSTWVVVTGIRTSKGITVVDTIETYTGKRHSYLPAQLEKFDIDPTGGAK